MFHVEDISALFLELAHIVNQELLGALLGVRLADHQPFALFVKTAQDFFGAGSTGNFRDRWSSRRRESGIKMLRVSGQLVA
ncbi:hypothetical protein D3C77_298550 [compost metagenome]